MAQCLDTRQNPHVLNGFEGPMPMTWPVTLKLDSAAYPLSVVQRAAYSLADTVAIQVGIEASQISLTAFPAEARLTLSPGAGKLADPPAPERLRPARPHQPRNNGVA